MTLPTIQKTWQYDVNNLIAGVGVEATNNAAMMWQIKESMIGFDLNPWTVAGSSNGAGAFGMDAVDRWTASSDLRWATSGNISWIVLEQSGIDGYFQLLISTNVASTYNINMSFSKGGLFTGGTATAPPTAADSVVVKAGTNWGGVGGSSMTSARIHAMQSNDGQCTRIAIFRNEASGSYLKPNFTGFWIFDRIYEPSTGWATPYVCGVVGNQSAGTDIGLIANFGPVLFGVHNSTAMTIYPTWEGTFTGTSFSTLMTSHNKISGKYQLYPVGIASLTIGGRGRHGQIYDMWWSNTYLPDGNKFTDGAANDDFIKIGCFILPWPSAVQLLRA